MPDPEVSEPHKQHRSRRRTLLIGFVAVLVVLAAAAVLRSYLLNRAFAADTNQRAQAVANTDWSDGASLDDKLTRLDRLVERLDELDEHQRSGPPIGLRLMYAGDGLRRLTLETYVDSIQAGFVAPCRQRLSRRLAALESRHGKMTSAQQVDGRRALKTYLMLSDVANLDVEWATDELTGLWADVQAGDDPPPDGVGERTGLHIRRYLELTKPTAERGARAQAVQADRHLVESARQRLQAMPVRQRLYALLIDSVSHERDRLVSGHTWQEVEYSYVSLEILFEDWPKALRALGSKHHQRTGEWLVVEAPYTHMGCHTALSNVAAAAQRLESESWVVVPSAEERGERLEAHLAKLGDDYEQRYIDAWLAFLQDIEVTMPANLREAIKLYDMLMRPPTPYDLVLRALEDHTQPRPDLQLQPENTWLYEPKQHEPKRRIVPGRALEETLPRVPAMFAATVAFGVPDRKAPHAKTPLHRYFELLADLREKMDTALYEAPNAGAEAVMIPLEDARCETEELLAPFDDTAKRVLRPLLQRPLNVGGKVRSCPPR